MLKGIILNAIKDTCLQKWGENDKNKIRRTFYKNVVYLMWRLS